MWVGLLLLAGPHQQRPNVLHTGGGDLTKGHLGNGRLEHRKRRNTCLHHTGGLPPELLNGCMQYLLAAPLYVDILMLEASCSHAVHS